MKTKCLYRQATYSLLCFIFIWLASACSLLRPTSSLTPTVTSLMPLPVISETATPEIKATSTSTRLPTLTLTPLPENSSTPNPTATDISSPTPVLPKSSFTSLSPGQYVVYYKKGELYAVSTDGSIRQYLLEIDGYAVSSDGWKIAYVNDQGQEFIIDLEHNALITPPPLKHDCSYFNVSPGLKYYTMSCNDGEAYVVSLEDGSTVPITHIMSEHENYFFPLWSPDGKWVAVLNRTYPPQHSDKTDEDDGLYLIDMSCLAEPGTCPSKMYGPFQDNLYLHGPYVWSPDSRKLALPARSEEQPIKIFDIQTQAFHNLDMPEEYRALNPFAWSPDGDWIAFEWERNGVTGISILPSRGGKAIELVNDSQDVYLRFWMTVPWPVQPGTTFTITEAGANLRIRSQPGWTEPVLRRLQPGAVVEILEGTVDVDGFHWWKVRLVGEETEGWAIAQPNWYEPTAP